MATDMDIDMDIDVGFTAEDFGVPGNHFPAVQAPLDSNGETPILNAPENQDSAPLELVPNKIHLRFSIDDLKTKDLRAFASEHYIGPSPENIEWIDDTSANLVYENEAIALEALQSFVEAEIEVISNLPLLQSIEAKALSSNPQAKLEVRRAVIGDRKAPRAREKSRFYLMHPEYDPAERRRRGGDRGPRSYRERDDGGYRSQRYDDREQENRRRDDEAAGFDASLYDDDDAALARRSARNRVTPPSENESGGRRVRLRGTAGKELFPDAVTERGSGRLRDRSASPLRGYSRESSASLPRGDRRDLIPRGPREDTYRRSERRLGSAPAADNKFRAQEIKAKMREAVPSKELFPQKTKDISQRSGVFSVADATDLFATTIRLPFVDGSGDRQDLKSSTEKWDNITGFSIKGASKPPPVQTFNIKGAASVKELFPSHFGDNSGKELFGVEGRGRRRQKAEDLFY